MIELVTFCQTFHVLPNAGGINDQPAQLMDDIALVLIAQGEKAERQSKRVPKGKG